MSNAGRPIEFADLIAGPAFWLLEIEWSGRVYRFASEMPGGVPLVITDADGTAHQYRSTLPQLSFRTDYALFSESSAPDTISLDLYFDETDGIAALISGGADLSTASASLYRWAPGIAYEDRRGVFYGEAWQPTYGSTDEPVSITFEAPIYRDGGRLVPGRMDAAHLAVSSDDFSTGDPYPVILGAPGISGTSGGSPAYVIDSAAKTLLAAGHPLDGQTAQLWSVSREATETSTTAAATDLQGNPVTIVTSTDASFDAEDDYAIEWSGTSIGGGDLLEYCARHSTLRVDWGRMASARQALNAFKFDLYIDAGPSAWDFAVRNIVPLLPCAVTYGPRGVYVRPWNFDATAADARATLDVANGVVRVGRVQYESNDPINEISISYRPDVKGKPTRTRTLTGRQDLGDPPEYIANPYAIASRSRLMALDAAGPRQGVRSKQIDAPYVYEDATAIAILNWQIRALSNRRRAVVYRDTSGLLEWLEDGDHVLITDPDLSLSASLAMIRSRRWEGGAFYLDLILIDDPLRT